MHRLKDPVGRHQINHGADVREVQRLLDAFHVARSRARLVRIDGRYGPRTEAAIEQFQREEVGLRAPDAVVSPDGPTWSRLRLQDLEGRTRQRAAKAGGGASSIVADTTTASTPADELTYLAKTLYGEASGQNDASKLAVGWSIRNRLATGRWGHSYRSVVTARLQYTCWSQSADPNGYARIQNPSGKAWDACIAAANAVIHANETDNPLPGATHYFSPVTQAALHKLKPKLYQEVPPWAKPPAQLVPNPAGVSDSDFRFYKNVR